ncbi:glycosyltransferase [Dyella caseinilytica]|uniref:Glycosyltransferase n=1 Tax=Dyella caseinilytica TaxID=1849581 RepID=A0ABX7GVA8_9GAMM|nr:glycosyltransferase [Dyella caseinilytica]QRN54397.1 glycosyltransferase [Dyella caseinilytica]
MLVQRQVAGLLLNFRDAGRSVACVQSLLVQQVVPVLVWDNSEDGGKSAEEISDHFKGDDRVSVIVSDRNLGFAGGVNRGIDHLRKVCPNAWVLLINNDAKLLQGAVLKLLGALERNLDARVAYPNINHGERILGTGYYQKFLGLLLWQRRRGYFAYPSGCCFLIATERTASPLLDEDFFMYGEDWEFGWRLSRNPGSIAHVDEVLVIHEGAASSRIGSLFYESHMVAAHLILARKLARSIPELWLLLLLRVLILPLRALVRVFRFHSLIPLRALWQGTKIALKLS